ncbi:MAG: dTDP-4-dehydrorhamnose 3,5-epimerase family protein, partial [Terriglobia bacterium]
GFFGRTFCQKEFEAHNLTSGVAQCSVSLNRKKGTLRGMHYQVAPFEESKLVRCIRGSLYDVIIDLRSESSTFKRYMGVTLSAENRLSLYVPPQFAHGFQTLEDDTEVFYMISEFYSPGHQRGVRWNDPAFSIDWPDGERIIIDRDQEYLDFSPDCLSPGG